MRRHVLFGDSRLFAPKYPAHTQAAETARRNVTTSRRGNRAWGESARRVKRSAIVLPPTSGAIGLLPTTLDQRTPEAAHGAEFHAFEPKRASDQGWSK